MIAELERQASAVPSTVATTVGKTSQQVESTSATTPVTAPIPAASPAASESNWFGSLFASPPITPMKTEEIIAETQPAEIAAASKANPIAVALSGSDDQPSTTAAAVSSSSLPKAAQPTKVATVSSGDAADVVQAPPLKKASSSAPPVPKAPPKNDSSVVEAIKGLSRDVIMPTGDPAALAKAAILVQKHLRGNISRKKARVLLEAIPHIVHLDIQSIDGIQNNLPPYGIVSAPPLSTPNISALFLIISLVSQISRVPNRTRTSL